MTESNPRVDGSTMQVDTTTRSTTTTRTEVVDRMDGQDATGQELLVCGLLLIVALAVYTKAVIQPKLEGT